MEGLLSTVLSGSDQVQDGSTTGIAMRGNRKVTCVLLRTFQLVFLCFGSDRAETIAHRGHTEVVAGGWVEKTLKGLSLEEKAGQMLQVRYYADYQSFDSPEYKRLRDQIQKYHIGSVVFGMHFNQAGPLRDLPLDAAKVANQLQRDSELPLLLAADLERGVASRLKDAPSFPWPMAWGALYDPSTVGRFGAITAREARSVGIQWDLAPVVDLTRNSPNL